ncbi:MAG: hypothetical protein IT377_05685 [Polyangiaceae bacterium]|nr:hypothetical protein [Polyangiaceae bacterium]
MRHAKRLTLLKNVSLAPGVIALVTESGCTLCSSEHVSAHAVHLPALDDRPRSAALGHGSVADVMKHIAAPMVGGVGHERVPDARADPGRVHLLALLAAQCSAFRWRRHGSCRLLAEAE